MMPDNNKDYFEQYRVSNRGVRNCGKYNIWLGEFPYLWKHIREYGRNNKIIHISSYKLSRRTHFPFLLNCLLSFTRSLLPKMMCWVITGEKHSYYSLAILGPGWLRFIHCFSKVEEILRKSPPLRCILERWKVQIVAMMIMAVASPLRTTSTGWTGTSTLHGRRSWIEAGARMWRYLRYRKKSSGFSWWC